MRTYCCGLPGRTAVWQVAHMRMILAVLVIGLGVVTTVAGGAASYNFGIIADETGISGWNPMLWLLMFAGIATTLVGAAQAAITANDRPAPSTSRPVQR